MAVKIRMTRIGRRHRPFFRVNAIDSRAPRNGKIIEKLGHYDPIEKDPEKQIVLNRERVQYWLDNGAIPSETVSQILARIGIEDKHNRKRTTRRQRAKELAHKKGKLFTETEQIAAERAQEKAQKEAEEKAKAQEKAKKEKAEQEKSAEQQTDEKPQEEKQDKE